jgi:hypothetical protein
MKIMKSELLEKRTSPRVAMDFDQNSAGTVPRRPRIIDLGPGGACLWLSAPPDPSWHSPALEFHYAGQNHVVHSRVVWSQACAAGSNLKELAFAEGWFAGFEFDEGVQDNWNSAAFHGILRSGDVSVSLLFDIDAADQSQSQIAPAGDRGLFTFSKSSVEGVKAAADELLPVLAKHFTDVNMVFTRDRIEISAPFRTPAELNPPPASRRDYRPAPASRVVETAAATTIEPPAAPLQPTSAPAMHWHRKVLIGAGGLAFVILAARFLGIFHSPEPAQATLDVPAAMQTIPAWAAGIDQSALDGWIKVQKKFGLSDSTVRAAVQVLSKNGKYSPGQDLHDLTRYPAQVTRAFSLLASTQNGPSFQFNPLENDLKGRVVQGARFPDEAPGGAYSPLERESFNNVVVLAVIELLQRQENDPDVKKILAALDRHRPS